MHSRAQMNCSTYAVLMRKRESLSENIRAELQHTWGQKVSSTSREEFLLEHMARYGDQLLDQQFVLDSETLAYMSDNAIAKYVMMQASTARLRYPLFFHTRAVSCVQVTMLPCKRLRTMRYAVTILTARYVGEVTEPMPCKMIVRPQLLFTPPRPTVQSLLSQPIWATHGLLAF